MNKQQTRQIVQTMLSAGYTVNQIAEELDLSLCYVRKIKHDLGLTVPRRDPREDTQKIIELFEQGYTRSEIAYKLGWSIGTVGVILKENGHGRYKSQEDFEPVKVIRPKKREPVKMVDRTGKVWLDIVDIIGNSEGDSIWNM